MRNTNYSINKLNYALIPFQYYMKSFDDSLDMWMHRHEYFEIMYVNSGNIVIKVSPDENLKDAEVYNLTQGQFIFLKPNLYHQMIINKNETAFVYNVEFLPVDNNNEIIKNAQSIITVDFEKLFFDTKLNNFMKSEAGFIITTDTAQVGTTIKELIFAANQKKNTKESELYQKISNSMGVDTHTVRNRLHEGGGELEIKYAIDMDNNFVSKNTFLGSIPASAGWFFHVGKLID